MEWQIIYDAAIVIGAPVVRSVSGWFANAIKDRKITKFEWKELAYTLVKMGTIGLFAYFGFSIAGVENAALASAVAAFFSDKLFSSLKENKSVK